MKYAVQLKGICPETKTYSAELELEAGSAEEAHSNALDLVEAGKITWKLEHNEGAGKDIQLESVKVNVIH